MPPPPPPPAPYSGIQTKLRGNFHSKGQDEKGKNTQQRAPLQHKGQDYPLLPAPLAKSSLKRQVSERVHSKSEIVCQRDIRLRRSWEHRRRRHNISVQKPFEATRLRRRRRRRQIGVARHALCMKIASWPRKGGRGLGEENSLG